MLYKKRCPKCAHIIRMQDIEDNFSCPFCNTNLRANARQSWFWVFVIGLVISPLVFVGAAELLNLASFTRGGFIELKFILGIAYAAVIIVLRPIIVRIWVTDL